MQLEGWTCLLYDGEDSGKSRLGGADRSSVLDKLEMLVRHVSGDV